MNNLETQIEDHLSYCANQKRLDHKTIKAYRIDLYQFSNSINSNHICEVSSNVLESYITQLHQTYKPHTVKRKIASIKAFFHYLEYKDIIQMNPFNKLEIRFREPLILPKTIPLHTVEFLLSTIRAHYTSASTGFQKKNALRDLAVVETLFSTGMRICELCSLKINDVDLINNSILIWGKGAKERYIQIGSEDVIDILKSYQQIFFPQIQQCNHFFANQNGTALSEQSVRRILSKYVSIAKIDLHITPHMFRHTFATSLLEADVDIRYIQRMLGHSSINVTEIYTQVTTAKQRDILTTKHPRQTFKFLPLIND